MNELNQIEQIGKLFVKSKSYLIPSKPKEGQEQITVVLKPLGLEDIGLINMNESSDMNEMSKNVISLWAVSLGISEENAGKISIEFMKDLMNAFIDINNFNEEDMKKTGIKDFIEKKQKGKIENDKQDQ